ncbi:hypothetical protein [Nocardia sp. NPDC046763]|uniref:hypothetical protein n=1 Tax=Nocardia sp. NPDC046763 TaxID=3155256 RepID=UPI00340EFB66
MGTLVCQDGTLDGKRIGRFEESDRVIVVAPHDDAQGLQIYTFDFLSTLPELVRHMDAAGFPARYTPDITATTTGVGVAESLRIQVGPPLPNAIPLPMASSWHQDDHGTGLMRLTISDYHATIGIGSVATALGTPIADLLGSTQGAGVGIVAHYDNTFTLSYRSNRSAMN